MSEPPRSLPPDGARCALHPEREADQICARCGNYMCNACLGSDRRLCSACASRLDWSDVFPFSRERYTIAGLLEFVWGRWKEHWLLLSLCFGGAIGLIYGASEGGWLLYEEVAGPAPSGTDLVAWFLRPGLLALQVAQSVLQVVMFLALNGLCLDLLTRKPPSWQRTFGRMRALPAALAQVFASYAAFALLLAGGVAIALLTGVSLGSPWRAMISVLAYVLAAAPVVVYVGLGVSLCMIPLALDPRTSALAGIRRSWRAVSHQRLTLIGMTLLVALIMTCGALCCVGLLISVPISTLLYCALYLALDDERRTPEVRGEELLERARSVR